MVDSSAHTAKPCSRRASRVPAEASQRGGTNVSVRRSSALRARRAEFAALPGHEAYLRLMAARRALNALGLRTDTFVPPRWLASPGTVDALREQGFVVCADESAVRLLGAPDVVLPGRVMGFRASGEVRAVAEDRRAAEAWRARALLAEVGRTVRRDGLVRLAVRAKDLRRPARVGAVLKAVDAALAAGAVPATYRALASVARAA